MDTSGSRRAAYNLFQQTLDEEEEMNEKLSELAMSGINSKAMAIAAAR